jgi:GPH family glycoside/pentoside/hexuronide:cation symporter
MSPLSNGTVEGRLSRRVVLSYGLPRAGLFMMTMTVSVYLPKYYTDTLLLAPGLLAWTFLIGRVWDAMSDPLVGYLSDRTRSRLGRRRPFFLVSALPVAVLYFLLWSPRGFLAEQHPIVYVTVVYLLCFTFWTVFTIPHSALAAELTMDHHERTVLTGTREAFGVVGSLVGLTVLPLAASAFHETQRGYSVAAAGIGALAMVLICICFFNVRENPEFRQRGTVAFTEGIRVMIRNRPFRVLTLCFAVCLSGMSFLPVLTLYVAQYMVKTPRVGPVIPIVFLLGASLSILGWTRLSKRYGKKETVSATMIVMAGVYASSLYYHEGTWLIWIVLATLAGTGYGCLVSIMPSMAADVVDLDELHTGKRREGAYFGIWHLIDKAAQGFALFLGLQLLGLLGYVPHQEQPLRVILGLKLLYSLLPAICCVVFCFLLRGYPIDAKEHARIRAEIEEKGQAAREPPSTVM